MKNYLRMPLTEVREFTETILAGYFKGKKRSDIRQIDIEDFARYLKLKVCHVPFAEDDKGKLGFLSDGTTTLQVYENGSIVKKTYPKDTIVIDSFLCNPEYVTKYRYTVSHEIGHHLLTKYGYAPSKAAFSNDFDSERGYDFAELDDMFKLNESQANTVGAYLLMPMFLVKRYVKEQFGNRRIPVYGRYMMRQDTKQRIARVANQLGVSFGALRIQLEHLNLIDYHDATEFVVEVEN